VATLFVSLNRQMRGEVDLEAGTVTTFEEGEAQAGHDLLNLAAMQAISQGGSLFVLQPEDMPGGEALAAVYRF
jgi:hypothetical protein